MKQILTITLSAFFLLFVNQLSAQNNEVCGFIQHYFDKTPVSNVKVFIENSVAISITDEAGAFCINLTEAENKIIFEKENYFKTFVTTKAGDFLSIKMVKNSEQNLALAKGLALKDIENLNHLPKSKMNNKNTTETIVEDIEEEIADFPPMAEAELMATKTGSSKTKRGKRAVTLGKAVPADSGPVRISGPAGADGRDGADAPAAMKSRESVPDSRYHYSGERKVMSSKIETKESSGKDKKSSRTSEAPREELAETRQEEIKAGRLTAGEIHDFSKWNLWNDLSENDLSQYKNVWSVYPKERYAVQAVTEQGFPLVDATVTLNIDDEIVWSAKTDNTGKAELWNILFEKEQASKKETANIKGEINYKGIKNTLPQLKRFEEGLNIITFKQACEYAKNVDIAFVVDATGSMGDEIDFLKVELLDVIQRVQTEFEDLNIRLGNVFYRDKTDAYLTKNSPLTQNIKAGVAFIKDQRAGGGGDFPEAVDVGLEEAVNDLQWSNEAVARILFLVLDAPPHKNETVNKKLQQTISKAAQKGIRIVPVVGSGIDKSTEYLLRSCALATNGHYIFLTDHSGVGGSHLKPSTDSYDVKNLNDLLVDLVMRYVQVQDCDAEKQQVPTVIEPQPDAKLKILPNPNDGRFLIQSTTNLKELFITDANGKILIRFTDFVTGENQVDISNFPTGSYFVRYEQDGRVVSQKVIKR